MLSFISVDILILIPRKVRLLLFVVAHITMRVAQKGVFSGLLEMIMAV